jgi:hypothetical protein
MEEAMDLCSVKDCYDGFVSREINGYSTLFGCPVCTRYDRMIAGKTAVPTIKRWMGKYEEYTGDEMEKIRKERVEMVMQRRSHDPR